MRAMYGSRIPLIRMTNINLEPSDWTKEEIIKDTKNGILATGAILAIFDQRRRTYIFGGEIGWKIENHEITEPVKFPDLSRHLDQFVEKLRCRFERGLAVFWRELWQRQTSSIDEGGTLLQHCKIQKHSYW